MLFDSENSDATTTQVTNIVKLVTLLVATLLPNTGHNVNVVSLGTTLCWECF